MRFLLFFHGGSLNRGAEAIVVTAIAQIKEHFPDAVIDLASTDPDSDLHIKGIRQVIHDKNERIKAFSIDRLINLIYLKVFKSERFVIRKKRKAIIDIIPDYDVFLSTGGDNYCYGEQPEIYEIDRQIKKQRKKLVLWGASIGPEDLSEQKIKDLKSFDLLLARETYTSNALKEAGLDQVRLIADGAFLLEKEQMKLPDGWTDQNTIGFNYSPLVYNKNKLSKTAAFKLIEHILKTTDYNILLIPHVVQKGNNDHKILKEFLEEFSNAKRLYLLPDNLKASQYKGYISQMKLFIGARTHATIAAYSSSVPTMVLGYSVKSKGIAHDLFGEEKLVLALKEISDANKLIYYFENLDKEAPALKKHLNLKIPEIKSKAKQAGSILKEMFE